MKSLFNLKSLLLVIALLSLGGCGGGGGGDGGGGTPGPTPGTWEASTWDNVVWGT